MLVFLPREIMTITEILDALSYEQYSAMSWRQMYHHVDVLMPRFTLHTSFDAVSVLRGLGVSRVFEPGQAELTRMLEDTNEGGRALLPHVSHMQQEARIAVDEKGSVAVVATRQTVSIACSAPQQINPRPVTFHADRPFAFVITDRRGAILFIGWISDPRQS